MPISHSECIYRRGVCLVTKEKIEKIIVETTIKRQTTANVRIGWCRFSPEDTRSLRVRSAEIETTWVIGERTATCRLGNRVLKVQ